MPETRKVVSILGHDINVVDVPIKSAAEYFNEYELEDGSKLKVKCSAASFVRVEGEFAPDGKPIYLVYTSPAINVLSVPEGIMRKGQAQQQSKKPN